MSPIEKKFEKWWWSEKARKFRAYDRYMEDELALQAYTEGYMERGRVRKYWRDIPDMEKSKYIRVPLASYWARVKRVETLEKEALEKNNTIFELSAEVVSLKLLLDYAEKRLDILENYHTLVLDYKRLLEETLMSEGRMIFK